MDKETFLEITRKFLYKELSYDGESDTKCPYCNKVISEGTKYLYHYESMAGNLINKLGLTGLLSDAILRFFIDREYSYVSGKRGEDSKNFSEELYKYLYE